MLAAEEMEVSVRVAELVHVTFPDLFIFARARNRQHEIHLRSPGGHFVVRDTLLSTLELTRQLMTTLGLDAAAVDAFDANDAQP